MGNRGKYWMWTLLLWVCFGVEVAGSERMDLAGLWRFQLDPMGFGKTPGSELYLSKLTETIVLPGSTDEGERAYKMWWRMLTA